MDIFCAIIIVWAVTQNCGLLSLLQKAHDILKKAWNVEGSPFKGTPFDPTKVQVTGMW